MLVRKAGLGHATCHGGAPDVCTLSTCGELHHEHQTEVQLYVLAVTKPPAFHR